MKYDFDEVCSRTETNCVKWDAVASVFGNKEVLPLWVADMDFPAAKPIVDALKSRAEHEFYGYTQAGHGLIEAIIERAQRKFNWKIEPEWIVFTAGVVPALNIAVRAVTRPGDEVVLQTPVYYPFFTAVTNGGCQILVNELRLKRGHYEMDFANLDEHFHAKIGMRPKQSRAKAIVLCNPQNPVGRVWTKEELTQMGNIAIGHGGVVISDEIHCELLYKGAKHTPFAAISKEFEQNSMICMAPSKTFNLPGLGASTVIIPNKKLRRDFQTAGAGIMSSPNLFGLTAMEAAYRHGDEWLEQLLAYIQGNLYYTLDFFEDKIPLVKVIKPEGTYLVWLDFRKLGLKPLELRTFLREKALVGLDDGFLFGQGGEGFARMNIACPRGLLTEAFKRLERAIAGL